jgi:type IV fimbrial biogenesis protein FimT
MNNQIKGFTLIDLLTAVSIVSILFGIGLPSMRSFITSSEVASRVNQIAGMLNYSRQYSLTKNIVVTVCPSNDGETCSRDWSQGQIAFTDKNKNHIKDDEDIILRAGSQLPKNHVITWRAFQNKNYLQYSPQGFTRYQNGTYRYCVIGDDLSFNRALIVTISGRIRGSKDSDGDGVHEDRVGETIACS